MAIDYKQVIGQAIGEYDALIRQRQELDLKLAQKEQFIRATMYQLSDADREKFEQWFNSLMAGAVGLSDSIRGILSANPRKWHTATEVRDALKKSGFSFAGYASNPLASIHAALKRLKKDEAEMTEIDGVMAWRAKPELRVRRRKRSLDYPYGALTNLTTLRGLLNGGTLSDMSPKNELPPPGRTHAPRPKGVFARAKERSEQMGKLSDAK